MAASAVPQGVSGRSFIGKVAAVFAARAAARRKPSRVAGFIADHTGTLAALGFADTACWHWGTGAGLIGTAACILVAEFKVRG